MAQAHTDKVLIDEPFLTSYLGALLKATPPMELDIPPAWATAQEPSSFASVHFGRRTEGTQAEQLALIEALRKENEQLKFNAELAKIDVEVLRGENLKLHSEITNLKGTLGDTQTAFKDLRERHRNLQSETDPLKTRVTTLQAELQALHKHQAEQAATLLPANLTHTIVPEAVSIAPASTPEKPQQDTPHEKTCISSEERQIVLGNLLQEQPATQSQHTETPAMPQPTHKEKAAAERAEARRKLEIIAHSVAESARSKKPNQVGSRIVKPTKTQMQIVVSEMPEPRNTAVVIPKEVPQTIHTTEQPLEPPSAPADEAPATSEFKPPLNPEEIQLEQLPLTLTAKRKNADNYRQMQEEAEEVTLPKGYSITVT